ncbi:class I SAM-dependent DNA methyltransferase [Albimonas pacifica]|uniref:Predicted methyltransferase, contains TPR repeat n=1 Tax=Albimonas pacifica TaxID=1114924 RepID=A0A1I3JXV7_9RHOB|nr:methyltransferase [Albimonas pacifica]SFI65087.1 Predicted methyltransferase, contains TPR repeat [Albimonas pacifica]
MTAETEDAPTDPLEAAYARALALEKAGEADAAAEAWREVLALDPEDHGGAAVRIASLQRGEAPDRAPPAYVATLFDQHAASFEEILVGQLGYRAPTRLAEMLAERLPAGAEPSFLDLGCGTGLMAAALDAALPAERGHSTGLDLSEEMLGEADERGLYDALYVGDAVAFLHAPQEDEDGDVSGPWDLIAAADVLPYLGALEELFAGAFAQLVPGGLFAFSTETLPEDAFPPSGWTVGPHQRFHHSERYIRSALAEAGFEIAALEPWTIRTNLGNPEPGHLVIARRPA